MKKKKVVLYFYNRLMDPLIQGNIFQYVYNITNNADACPYQFAVITYEDSTKPLSAEQIKSIQVDFSKRNITWKPIAWHPGTSPAKKAADLMSGLAALAALRSRGYKYVVSLASVAGSFAYVASVLLRMKLYLYQYEPHSEYAVDNHIWSEDSINNKTLKYLEKRSALHATVISTGTRHMIERLNNWHVKASIYKIPSVTNDAIFVYDADKRLAVRQKFGIPEGKKVVVYPGKFGDLYYGVELFYVFKWISEAIPDLFLLILTSNDHMQVKAWIKEAGIPDDSYVLGAATAYKEMPGVLSAADFGIVNVPPGPSKKFISNIKVGEYLCCGLPYLICSGISEDDWYAETKNVGVVVPNFSKAHVLKGIPKIEALLSEPKESQVERCRRTGVEYRGVSNLQLKFEEALKALTA